MAYSLLSFFVVLFFLKYLFLLAGDNILKQFNHFLSLIMSLLTYKYMRAYNILYLVQNFWLSSNASEDFLSFGSAVYFRTEPDRPASLGAARNG